jgi:hypothetical protein
MRVGRWPYRGRCNDPCNKSALATERRLIERDEWTPPAMRTAAKKAKAVTVAEYIAAWIEHRNIKPRTKVHY